MTRLFVWLGRRFFVQTFDEAQSVVPHEIEQDIIDMRNLLDETDSPDIGEGTDL